MIRTTPADRAIDVRAAWPVARVLVGLGLVLALLMGCWAATHLDAEGGPSAPIAGSIGADRPATVLAGMTAGEHAGDAGDLGAALCLLGVACALALVVLAWRAPSRTYRLEHVAGAVRELFAVPPSQRPVLTLTQLRVSRT